MSAAVEEQVASPAPEVVANSAEKPEQNGNGVQNGDAHTDEVKKNGEAKKEKQPPIDPKEDFIGWLGQQSSYFTHAANFEILDLISKAFEDETKRPKLPENKLVTKSEFVQHLQDGTLLCNFANFLKPNSVEGVKDGEELKENENKKSNLETFAKFLKEEVGLEEEKIFKPEDLLEKGKAAYPALIQTLVSLFKSIPEKFEKSELQLDALIDSITKLEPQNVLLRKFKELTMIIHQKFRRQPVVKDNKDDKEVKSNGEQKAEEVAPVVEEKKEEAPAAVSS